MNNQGSLATLQDSHDLLIEKFHALRESYEERCKAFQSAIAEKVDEDRGMESENFELKKVFF